MGYCGGSGEEAAKGSSTWWGVTDAAQLLDQLQHAENGVAHGDESMDAYFKLYEDGKIERYAANGSLIKSGEYRFENVEGNEWKVADLYTTAGTILFPYQINGGGYAPTQFDVIYKTDKKMTLVYPDGGAFEELGNWSEATYWHFKVKEAAPAPTPTPAPTPQVVTESIISQFTYCWNGSESFTANGDGTITYYAAEWGGLAAWLANDGPVDLSGYSKLVFEFAEATTVNTQILVQKGGVNIADAWGEPGIDKLECSFSGKNVSAVEQIALQTSASTTITIKKIYLVKK